MYVLYVLLVMCIHTYVTDFEPTFILLQCRSCGGIYCDACNPIGGAQIMLSSEKEKEDDGGFYLGVFMFDKITLTSSNDTNLTISGYREICW